MIHRDAEDYLQQWYLKKHRKPLVIRGARQVGKSTLVREFSKRFGHKLIEINLEKHLSMEDVFKRLDVKEILNEISILSGEPLIASNENIIFLDEIQATPSAIPTLRYLYEENPEIPVIAAGSLLEFTLADHNYSMPVGRIEFLYLGPLFFFEFVRAMNSTHLVSYIKNIKIGEKFSNEAHEQLLRLLREYFMIGGMPEAVSVYLDTQNITQALQVHHSILDTYRNDFNKYSTGKALQRIQRVYDYIPSATGEKFKYSNVNPNWQARDVRNAVDLLDYASVIFKVHCTDGSGIPLNANADNKIFKPYFLDVGLMNTASGIKLLTREDFFSTRFINEGKMAEQFVAQHLRFEKELYIRPQLHYWLREKRATNAEIDFLIQAGQFPIPVEVKSGKSGSLKSLHIFCDIYQYNKAVRLDLNTPSVFQCNHKISSDKRVSYELVSLPLYMVEEIKHMIGRT
jgi:hypothetical protein